MHWMELIKNSEGKYSFTTTRKALTQKGKNRKTRGKDKVLLETNSSGCHNGIARGKRASFIIHFYIFMDCSGA